MRTAKLVEMIKEIGNNNNMVLGLNERVTFFSPDDIGDAESQPGGFYGKGETRLYKKGLGQQRMGQPPTTAVGPPQRQQPGPEGGLALDRFNASVAANNSKLAAKAQERLDASTPAAAVAAAAAGTKPGAPAPKPMNALGQHRDKNLGMGPVGPVASRGDTDMGGYNPSQVQGTTPPAPAVATQTRSMALASSSDSFQLSGKPLDQAIRDDLRGRAFVSAKSGEASGAPESVGQNNTTPAPAPAPAPASAPAPAPASASVTPAPAPAPQQAPAARQAQAAKPADDSTWAQRVTTAYRAGPGNERTSRNEINPFANISEEEYTRSQKRVNMRTTKLVEMIKKIGKKRIDETSRRYSRTKTNLSMAGRYNRGQQLAQEEEQIKNNPGKTMTGKRADTIEMKPEATTTKLDR